MWICGKKKPSRLQWIEWAGLWFMAAKKERLLHWPKRCFSPPFLIGFGLFPVWKYKRGMYLNEILESVEKKRPMV
jgi:hypothetical protein